MKDLLAIPCGRQPRKAKRTALLPVLLGLIQCICCIFAVRFSHADEKKATISFNIDMDDEIIVGDPITITLTFSNLGEEALNIIEPPGIDNEYMLFGFDGSTLNINGIGLSVQRDNGNPDVPLIEFPGPQGDYEICHVLSRLRVLHRGSAFSSRLVINESSSRFGIPAVLINKTGTYRIRALYRNELSLSDVSQGISGRCLPGSTNLTLEVWRGSIESEWKQLRVKSPDPATVAENLSRLERLSTEPQSLEGDIETGMLLRYFTFVQSPRALTLAARFLDLSGCALGPRSLTALHVLCSHGLGVCESRLRTVMACQLGQGDREAVHRISQDYGISPP